MGDINIIAKALLEDISAILALDQMRLAGLATDSHLKSQAIEICARASERQKEIQQLLKDMGDF